MRFPQSGTRHSGDYHRYIKRARCRYERRKVREVLRKGGEPVSGYKNYYDYEE